MGTIVMEANALSLLVFSFECSAIYITFALTFFVIDEALCQHFVQTCASQGQTS